MVVLSLSVAALVAAGAITYNIASFYSRSDSGGRALIHQVQRQVARAQAHHTCTSVPAAPSGTSLTPSDGVTTSGLSLAGEPPTSNPGALPTPDALLKAPSIGLDAPVVEGTGDGELAVAVGRVPASAEIGEPGTVVLAAHDVTWFSKLDQLHTGDTLSLVRACSTLIYQVTSQQVVAAGTPIYPSGQPTLVLVTCYPLNALFLTSQRYLVNADLIATKVQSRSLATFAVGGTPTVPIPPALAALGLDLNHNATPLGTLTLSGPVDAAWQQSAAPLDDQASLLTLYFGAIHAARSDNASWWTAIAPSVPLSNAAPLNGASISHYGTTLDTTLNVNGAQLSTANLTAQISVSGGSQPGRYTVSMDATSIDGSLVITGWSMTPVTD